MAAFSRSRRAWTGRNRFFSPMASVRRKNRFLPAFDGCAPEGSVSSRPPRPCAGRIRSLPPAASVYGKNRFLPVHGARAPEEADSSPAGRLCAGRSQLFPFAVSRERRPYAGVEASPLQLLRRPIVGLRAAGASGGDGISSAEYPRCRARGARAKVFDCLGTSAKLSLKFFGPVSEQSAVGLLFSSSPSGP
jgi:hypothetical protein